MKKYDLAILGAGPGGYVAAIRAAQKGLAVALIEKDEVGGVCLNSGCIPTKTLISSTNLLRKIRSSKKYGIDLAGEPKANLEEIVNRKSEVVQKLVKGIHQLIKMNLIDLIKGNGQLTDNKEIEVDSEKIEAKKIILATGSEWKSLPNIRPDKKYILTSTEMLNLKEIPESLIILGGGVIGCEFASIFSALGSKVIIVEACKNILPMEDEVTSRSLARALKRGGVEIIANTMAEKCEIENEKIKLALSDNNQITGDKLLLSIGRTPNTANIGLEGLDIKTEKGTVVTNDKMETNIENIYAIGDINGKYMLAHTASEEGIVAVSNIVGEERRMEYHAVPRPVYTHPEIGCVGLTQKEIIESGIEFNTGRFNYGASSKAACDGITEGHVILYTGKKDNRVLGAQLFGEYATELMPEITLAVRKRMNVDDISKTIHSHPTLSEILKESAEDSNDEAIHKIYRRR